MQHLMGWRIAITGKINGFNRAEAESLAEVAGAEVSPEVNRTINFVLVANYDAGRPANTKKLRDAKANGISIIDASNLHSLCRGDSKPSDFIQAQIQLNQPKPAPKMSANEFLSEVMGDVPTDYCI